MVQPISLLILHSLSTVKILEILLLYQFSTLCWKSTDFQSNNNKIKSLTLCLSLSEHPIGPQHFSIEPTERHIEQVSDLKLLRKITLVSDDADTFPNVKTSPKHRRQDAQRSFTNHAIQYEQIETKTRSRSSKELATLPRIWHFGVVLSKFAWRQDFGLRRYLEYYRSIEPFHLVSQRQTGQEWWTSEPSGPTEELERSTDGSRQSCKSKFREKFQRTTANERAVDSEEREDDREKR